MTNKLTMDQCEGLPHILVLESATGIQLIEFDGPEAMTDAHSAVYKLAGENGVYRILTAVRVRQTMSVEYAHKRNLV